MWDLDMGPRALGCDPGPMPWTCGPLPQAVTPLLYWIWSQGAGSGHASPLPRLSLPGHAMLVFLSPLLALAG